MNLRRIAAVASKEWRETTRDRMFLSLAFLLPVLWMLMFGYGLVLDVENIPLAALDRDHTRLSRDYLSRFTESRYFDFKGYLRSEDEVDRLLLDGSIRAAIIVPEQFQERLLAGTPATIQTMINGVRPGRADIIKSYVRAINGAFSKDVLVDYLAQIRGLTPEQARTLLTPVRLEVRYLYNQAVKSIWAMAPALVMFSLIASAPLLTALGVAREKESGSIYNIYSSSVSRLEFLVGKLSPHVSISAINVCVLWMLATQLFGVPFKGDLVFFSAASVVFLVCCTGIGLIVSLLVSTQMAAMIVTILVSIVPTFLFSGLITPVSSMPPRGQIQAHFFPAMYYTDIVRGGFLKGLGIEVLSGELAALALYAFILLTVGYLLFHKRPKR